MCYINCHGLCHKGLWSWVLARGRKHTVLAAPGGHADYKWCTCTVCQIILDIHRRTQSRFIILMSSCIKNIYWTQFHPPAYLFNLVSRLVFFQSASMNVNVLYIRDVRKTEIQFGFVNKKSQQNPSRPKIWHPCRRFSNRNCVQSAIQIKSDKKLHLHSMCR